jgi:hypothetical protein
MGRHLPRLVHGGHDGRAGPRLRRGEQAQPGPDHGEHVPDGSDRAGGPTRGLRLPRPRRCAASTR